MAHITEIRVHSASLPAKASYNMSSSSVSAPQSTIVAVRSDDGLVGWGEACLASPQFQPAHNAGVRTALTLLAPTMIGRDPMHLESINASMDAALTGHSEAKAALDIACWDLIGKQTNRSVVDLLGGPRMSHVSTYHVIGIGPADEAAADAVRLQDDGITRLQLKVGGRPVHEDIASIRAVGAVLRPGTDLAVDANRGWSVVEAIHASTACADVQLSLEQPCATVAELRHLRHQARHPIIVDENATDLPTIAGLISSGVADGFGLKITRLGGLTRMRAVRDLCMAARVPMSADDAWGGDIIASAGVAVGATLDPQFSRGAWLAHPYHQTHYDEANGPRLVDGCVSLPQGGPGLGLVLDGDEFGPPEAVFSAEL